MSLCLGTGCSFIDDFGTFTFDDGGVARLDGGADASVLDDGGGGGPDAAVDAGGADTTPPTVVSSRPEGPLVDTRTRITVTFDEPIAAGPSDMTLRLDGVMAVPGRAEVSGDTIEFVPTDLLATSGSYEATVSTAVTDVAGNALAAEHRFTFTLPVDGDGGVGNRRLDTLGSGDVGCPQLAMDQGGNAAVLFSRGPDLMLARYDAGIGWRDTEMVGAGSNGHLALSPGGTLAMAYTATVGGDRRLVTRFAAPGQPLGAPELADEGVTSEPFASVTCTLQQHDKAIAVNDAGQAVVVWFAEIMRTAADPIAHMNAYTPGVGWGTVVDHEAGFGFSPAPGAAVDAMGEAVVTLTPVASNHSFRRFSASSGLWAPVEPFMGGLGPVNTTRVAVDQQGFFTRAALNVHGGSVQVYATSATAAGSARPDLLFPPAGSIPGNLVMDGDDGLYLAWLNDGGVGVSRFAGSDSSWESRSGVVPPPADNPVIAGLGDSRRGALAWEAGSRVGVAELDVMRLPALPVAGVTGTLASTSGVTARWPLVAMDDESQHGILTWIEDAGGGAELHASSFYRVPPREMP